MDTVLITGGAGYIGSHIAAELLAIGKAVVILDNFANSTPEVVEDLGKLGFGTPHLVTGDLRDAAALERTLTGFEVGSVVHLAGLKSVAESVGDPLLYYAVNVGGAVALLEAMKRHGVSRLVFSSSATVYGDPEVNPIREDAPLRAYNPYGRTKLMIEQMINDFVNAEPDFASISLRYFNPAGAHSSGLIGERPVGAPNNLFPYIAQTAAGVRDRVRVFGDDYPTADGTGVRDYIHVVDLAKGHVAALDMLEGERAMLGQNVPINLGCGRGYSVLEAIKAFSRASGREIPFEIVPRRPGDVPECVADPARAAELLGWRAELGLDAMCGDDWTFRRRTASKA